MGPEPSRTPPAQSDPGDIPTADLSRERIPLPAEIIGGRYRVVQRLGKGAMGVVYKAHDPVLDRFVAIKKTLADLGDQRQRERFLVEARAAARLSHRNIVTVHEFAEIDGDVYIVMEFLPGVDLATLIRRQTPLSLAVKLNMLAQVCDGLDYAHRQGVVHRDIKPANLYLSDEGVVKILDFSIARLGPSKMTASGVIMGTPQYMAPEQFENSRVDARADLYAVGAVAYELLSGSTPFEADSLPSLLLKIGSERPAPLREKTPDLPGALATLVDTLLAKTPDERPASAAVVRDELRRIARPMLSEGEAETIIAGVARATVRVAPQAEDAVAPPIPALSWIPASLAWLAVALNAAAGLALVRQAWLNLVPWTSVPAQLIRVPQLAIPFLVALGVVVWHQYRRHGPRRLLRLDSIVLDRRRRISARRVAAGVALAGALAVASAAWPEPVSIALVRERIEAYAPSFDKKFQNINPDYVVQDSSHYLVTVRVGRYNPPGAYAVRVRLRPYGTANGLEFAQLYVDQGYPRREPLEPVFEDGTASAYFELRGTRDDFAPVRLIRFAGTHYRENRPAEEIALDVSIQAGEGPPVVVQGRIRPATWRR